MKKVFLILSLILSNLYVFAEPNPVIVHNGGSVDDRSQNLTQTDMPRVYYDNDTHEIIIDGGGEVSYYEVLSSLSLKMSQKLTKNLQSV